jgi:hypothetical protein
MVKISESMQRVLDVDEEKDKEIISGFKKNSKSNDVFVSIIAPYVGVRVTPSKEIMASMGLSEEFGIETVIEKIKDCNSKCENLYLLINSPGGLVQSSYKVARALRKNFKNIVVFIPHIAASGGSLVALTGNKIVMGMMSQLTPLDPHSDEIPALSVVRGFEQVTDFFRKMSEDDAPFSYKVLANKYDAVQLDMAISTLELMKNYIKEILKDAGYSNEKVEEISDRLVRGFYTHSDVIHMDKAKEIGLSVIPHTDYLELWNSFRMSLSKYLLKSADKHIIRYWINKGGEKDEKQK